MSDISPALTCTPYVSYAYAYPHKTAYRPLPWPIPLGDLWASEPRDALFLYIHVPFCEMRCGFCNLFTTVHPHNALPAHYLDALRRQAAQVRAALGDARFARLAIGGGTPTYLEPAQLHELFDLAESFGIDHTTTPTSVETSPHTATPERLRVLRERGVKRVSIGVQSFVEAEVATVGRSQRTADVEMALAAIRTASFPTLNIDLMYGLPGQSVASWLSSLRLALRYRPEELFLYPLYVRPLTGLGRRPDGQPLDDAGWDALRLACYRAARDVLRAEGYVQISMRMFRAAHAPVAAGLAYCCQEDGMIGLGCGARSYTSGMHYSSEYAVGVAGVRAILSSYVHSSDSAFAAAHYGVALSPHDQRRRYLIQSLLQAEGLNRAAYRQRFGQDVIDEVPQLAALIECGFAVAEPTCLQLTDAGLERSDAIGPWLYTASVVQLMRAYDLR
ncbi:MAG: coproporphyrinogen III oxidase family protein [Oscillochloris sp.]|nr:coproporphyrinogen III oxidase family protein [Oscillochloris sp.]